jgi:hypothetical protein
MEVYIKVNKSMRIGVVLMYLSFIFMLLNGCVKADYHVNVNWDGSMDVDYIMALDKVILASMEDDDPFADARQNAEEQGYTVEPYDDGTYEGLRVKKHFADANGITLSTLNNQLFDASNDVSLQAEKHLFTREIQIDTDIDLRNQQESIGESFLSEFMYGQADVKLRVTLPVKPKSHNADVVSEDGKSLEWEIELGENNSIQLNLVIPNVTSILITGGVGLLIALAAIIYVWKRRKTKRGD